MDKSNYSHHVVDENNYSHHLVDENKYSHHVVYESHYPTLIYLFNYIMFVDIVIHTLGVVLIL